MCARACLDQLLIVVISLILLCDCIQSNTRLIAIVKLIATLLIIYTSLLYTVTDCLSISYHCRCTGFATTYKHDMGRGRRWRVVAAAACCGSV